MWQSLESADHQNAVAHDTNRVVGSDHFSRRDDLKTTGVAPSVEEERAPVTFRSEVGRAEGEHPSFQTQSISYLIHLWVCPPVYKDDPNVDSD